MHRAGQSAPLLAIAALAAALVVSWVRPLVAVPPPPPNAQPGRFQSDIASSNNTAFVVVTDTTTGQTWSLVPNGGQGWQFHGTPEVTDDDLPPGARRD